MGTTQCRAGNKLVADLLDTVHQPAREDSVLRPAQVFGLQENLSSMQHIRLGAAEELEFRLARPSKHIFAAGASPHIQCDLLDTFTRLLQSQ
jgi:hypothetical protein